MKYKIKSIKEVNGRFIILEIKARSLTGALMKFKRITKVKGEEFKPDELVKFVTRK